MSVVIARERPDTVDATGLIAELDALLESFYPPESRNGFTIDKLLAEGVEFFLLRTDGTPAGYGGILWVDSAYGEIKRMYMRPQFRRLGFAKLMLNHLADQARSRNITLLRLEMGIHQWEAIGLYEQQGFYRIAPFGPYSDDPLCAGVDIEEKDMNGHTPLHWACMFRRVETVQALLRHHANIDARDVDGRTPLNKTSVPAVVRA